MVLEGKHIKEMGTHDQLIAQDGLYRRLYTVQQRLEPLREMPLAWIDGVCRGNNNGLGKERIGKGTIEKKVI